VVNGREIAWRQIVTPTRSKFWLHHPCHQRATTRYHRLTWYVMQSDDTGHNVGERQRDGRIDGIRMTELTFHDVVVNLRVKRTFNIGNRAGEVYPGAALGYFINGKTL